MVAASVAAAVAVLVRGENGGSSTGLQVLVLGQCGAHYLHHFTAPLRACVRVGILRRVGGGRGCIVVAL